MIYNHDNKVITKRYCKLHYDIFGYPGDHYYPHFMDYDDDLHYGDDYDKDDVDHGNFFVDQFHDLMDFFF